MSLKNIIVIPHSSGNPCNLRSYDFSFKYGIIFNTMGEKDIRLQRPPLFDPLPRRLRGEEQRIQEIFDGSIGSYGIVMFLDPLSGSVIRATFVDLFGQENKESFEPLQRAKWASFKKKDIEPGTPEYDKLNAIEDAVRARWLEWKAGNKSGLPLREFRVLRQASYPLPQVQTEAALSQETDKAAREKPKRKERSRLPRNFRTPDFLIPPREDDPRTGFSGYTSPEVAKRTEAILAGERRKFFLKEAEKRKKKKDKK